MAIKINASCGSRKPSGIFASLPFLLYVFKKLKTRIKIFLKRALRVNLCRINRHEYAIWDLWVSARSRFKDKPKNIVIFGISSIFENQKVAVVRLRIAYRF